jgi:hypothetical protein
MLRNLLKGDLIVEVPQLEYRAAALKLDTGSSYRGFRAWIFDPRTITNDTVAFQSNTDNTVSIFVVDRSGLPLGSITVPTPSLASCSIYTDNRFIVILIPGDAYVEGNDAVWSDFVLHHRGFVTQIRSVIFLFGAEISLINGIVELAVSVAIDLAIYRNKLHNSIDTASEDQKRKIYLTTTQLDYAFWQDLCLLVTKPYDKSRDAWDSIWPIKSAHLSATEAEETKATVLYFLNNHVTGPLVAHEPMQWTNSRKNPTGPKQGSLWTDVRQNDSDEEAYHTLRLYAS